MYNVSTAFHAAFADYGREIKAKVIFNGQTELDGNYVQEITATPAFDSSDGISVGSACSGAVAIVRWVLCSVYRHLRSWW